MWGRLKRWAVFAASVLATITVLFGNVDTIRDKYHKWFDSTISEIKLRDLQAGTATPQNGGLILLDLEAVVDKSSGEGDSCEPRLAIDSVSEQIPRTIEWKEGDKYQTVFMDKSFRNHFEIPVGPMQRIMTFLFMIKAFDYAPNGNARFRLQCEKAVTPWAPIELPPVAHMQ